MTYNEIRALRSLGMNDQTIKGLAKNYLGDRYTLSVGTTTDTPQIPGVAKVLLGISVFCTSPNGTFFTMMLNNETIFKNVPVNTILCTNQGMASEQYVEVLRKLQGKDVLQIIVETDAGQEFQYTLVYLSDK